MPKIIKRVGENSLETSSPNYFWNIDRPWCFKGAVLHILADNGDIYLVNGDSDSKEWNAYRHVSPAVEDKTDFWLMHMACVPTGEISKTFKTKKALITALEEGTAEFHKDEKKYYEDNYRSFKLRKKQQGKSSPYDLIKDTDSLTHENMLEFGRKMIAGAGERRTPTYQDPKNYQSSSAATEKDILELGRQMQKESNQRQKISFNSKTSDTDTNDDGAFTTGCITLIGIVVVIAIIIIAAG